MDISEKMDFWDIAARPNDQKVMYTNFILKGSRGENGNVKRYKARLEVYGNQDLHYYEYSFSWCQVLYLPNWSYAKAYRKAA